MRLLMMAYIPRAVLLALIVSAAAAAVFKLARNPPARKLIMFFFAAFFTFAYVFAACSILFSVTKFGIYGDTKPYSGNYVPFRTIMDYAENGSFFLFFTQVAGNILITLPLPFAVLFFSRTPSIKRVCLISLIITAAIEPLQIVLNIFIGGATNIIDIDDLILNLTGCVLGLLLLKAADGIRKMLKPSESPLKELE